MISVQWHVNCYLKVSCDSSYAICKALPPYAWNNSSYTKSKTWSVSVQNDTHSTICTVLPPHVLNGCSSALCKTLPPHVLNDSALVTWGMTSVYCKWSKFSIVSWNWHNKHSYTVMRYQVYNHFFTIIWVYNPHVMKIEVDYSTQGVK
jgi:hypothetical protein